MDKISQRAGEVFESGYYCAESVLLAVAESRGIESELIPRIATGFCGGMSRTCGTCGAVSGGVMAIGLCLGRTAPGESVAPAYSAVGKFSEKFKARFGSINCKDLTGCDLRYRSRAKLLQVLQHQEAMQGLHGGGRANRYVADRGETWQSGHVTRFQKNSR